MALNIKDSEAERLAALLAERLDTTKTSAIRYALRAQLAVLEAKSEDRVSAALDFLESEIWPLTGGVAPITKADREEILGYSSTGV